MANESKGLKLPERRKTWKKHLQACKDSGLTQKEYCHINNIPQNTFLYWKKQLGGQQSTSVSLVPLQIKSEFLKLQSSPLCLTIDDRYKIDMNKGFDPETLFQVLTVLKQV
jgi:hypothetical protein